MKKRYNLEIEIEAPIEQVSALFGDETNLPYWQPGYQRTHRDDAGFVGHVYQKNDQEIVLAETDLLDDLPRSFSATYSTHGMVMRVENYFESITPGRTRWMQHNEASLHGFVMNVIGTFLPNCFSKQSRLFMRHFKAFAEHGADVRLLSGLKGQQADT